MTVRPPNAPTPLLAGLTGRPLPALPRMPVAGDVRTAPGRTRLVR
ncbi:hypothetical protein AB0952_02320 [Streptomyces caniferus]